MDRKTTLHQLIFPKYVIAFIELCLSLSKLVSSPALLSHILKIITCMFYKKRNIIRNAILLESLQKERIKTIYDLIVRIENASCITWSRKYIYIYCL
jgi:hypothetical protein